MSNNAPTHMNRLSEAGYFLRIILLILQNKSENARAFYLPNANLLRSFFAFIWCIPAQLFMWSLLWNKLSEQDVGAVVGKTGFLMQLTLFDILGWGMSAAAIFIILSALNMKKAIVPLIISSNWFSLLAVYIFFIPDTLAFILPSMSDFIDILEFIVYFTVVGLYFRLVRHILGDQKLPAFAITLASVVMGLFLSSIAFQSVVQT